MKTKPLNFEELLIANPDHRYYKRDNGSSIWISCLAAGCLWQREYTRHMNALVRSSKQRSAFLKHLREVEAQKG